MRSWELKVCFTMILFFKEIIFYAYIYAVGNHT